jgi:hypothetical protein
MKQTNEHLTVIEVFQRIKTARETVGKNCIKDWYITNGGIIETPLGSPQNSIWLCRRNAKRSNMDAKGFRP